MRRLLILSVLLGAVTTSFGQGYIDFHNFFTSRVSTNGTLQAASPVGTWYYALLVAASTQNTISADFGGWTFAAMGTNTGVAGRLSGNSADGGLAVQIVGFAATATADFAVVGWSSNIGTDWNAFRYWWNNGQPGTGPGAGVNGWEGTSVVANDIPLAPFGGPYNSMFGPTSAGAISGLNLVPPLYDPEPSSFAIGCLGLASLAVWRRRK